MLGDKGAGHCQQRQEDEEQPRQGGCRAEQQQTTTVRFAGIGVYGLVLLIVATIVVLALACAWKGYFNAIFNVGESFMP